MKRRGLPRGAAPTPLPAWCQAQRRAQGRRHALCTVLAIAAGAILCGMRGYKAIAKTAATTSSKRELIDEDLQRQSLERVAKHQKREIEQRKIVPIRKVGSGSRTNLGQKGSF